MYNEIIVLGVLLSLLFAELTGVSPAGLVVAGYIALSLQTPLRIAYTLLIVLLTWWPLSCSPATCCFLAGGSSP